MKLSLYDTNPELIDEWDEELNKNIKNYTKGSKKYVYWKCKKYGHTWYHRIDCRTRNSDKGCPKCRSLYYNCTELLRLEWHTEKNEKSIYDYLPKSDAIVYWKCSENNEHVWKKRINIRNSDKDPGCILCKSFYYNCNNDILKLEWCEEINGSMENYYYKNRQRDIYWKCFIDNNHIWTRSIYGRNIKNDTGCPKCKSLLYHCCSDILKQEWHHNNKDMILYSPKSKEIVFWICSKNKEHIWKDSIFNRNKKNDTGCPFCDSLYYNCNNDILKLEWHEECNGSMKSYKYYSRKPNIHWICSKNSKHIWIRSIKSRNKKNDIGCPYCHSLLYNCNKLLKKEWLESINGQMINYSKMNNKIVSWKCSKNHIWKARIDERQIKGHGCCPICISCPKCHLWRTYGELCEYCKPQNKNKLYKKTKEWKVVKYLRKNILDHEFIHNKSVGNDCTGGHLFPDIRFDCENYNLIIEVDEHKHRGANYKCDKQRMYDIIAKLGQPCIFIRYNPDNKKSELAILLENTQKYLKIDAKNKPWNDYGYMVKYLFY